jgi:preprotein translocase subunit SecG
MYYCAYTYVFELLFFLFSVCIANQEEKKRKKNTNKKEYEHLLLWTVKTK